MPINQKNKTKYLIFPLLLILFSTVSNAETITLVADPWCPYSCLDTADRQGIGVDLATQIFEAAGFDVIYKNASWETAIHLVEKSEADVLIAASGVDSLYLRIPNIHFSYMNACFISRNDQWQYQTDKSLTDIKLGIVDEYIDGFSPLRKKSFLYSNSNNLLKTYPDTETLVKALHNNEIDVIHDNITVVGYLSKKNQLPENYHFSGCVRSKLFLGLSPTPKGERLEKIVNKGLLQALKNGAVKQVHQQYGIDNY